MSMLKRWIPGLLAVAMFAGVARAALTADDLVLIVNKQQPDGRRLAELYAKARGVPDGRIIELDIPDTVDMAREFYETSVADVVRGQLQSRGLAGKAKCLVLFYGVPLRVRERDSTPLERTEVDTVINPAIATLQAQLKAAAIKLETVAMSIDPNFKLVGGVESSEQIRDRIVAAGAFCKKALPAVTDPARKAAFERDSAAAMAALTTMPPLAGFSTTRPTTFPTPQQVDAWLTTLDDPVARRRVRQVLYAANNVFQLLVGLEIQKRTLTVKEGEASVDSELSCMNLGNYDRARWVVNPFFHNTGAPPELREKVIRVARIDGPTAQIAQRVIENSVAVEKTGLKGDLVLDARGLTGNGKIGSYDYFDNSIRAAVKLAVGATDLHTIFDNNEQLLPDSTSANTAVYSGWYRVRNYAPTVKLVPGSVAFHLASLEMITLRSPIEPGWCRGLMLDGADVTLGAVGEPYLVAFPMADDFLGLLMTGKVTLAEAYWASIPITSWKMVLIGDPLYRPFAANPQITAEKLPESLRRQIDSSR